MYKVFQINFNFQSRTTQSLADFQSLMTQRRFMIAYISLSVTIVTTNSIKRCIEMLHFQRQMLHVNHSFIIELDH